MVCLQGWPFKGLQGWGPNLSFLKYKIHILKPWVAILRFFPKADFFLGHPVLRVILKILDEGVKVLFKFYEDQLFKNFVSTISL